jgi:hypothetical protein
MKRNYNTTESNILAFTRNLINLMNRDITKFNEFGITITNINELNDKIDICSNLVNDLFYLSDRMDAIDEKNNFRNILLNALKNVSKCFLIKYGLDSAEYKMLDASNIAGKRDPEILTICRKDVTIATDYLPELLSVGLTQLKIDSLATAADGFESALLKIDEAIRDRNLNTIDRIKKYNSLYSDAAKYSKIGKLIWENIDETKYNDYLIYRAGGTTKPKYVKKKKNEG